VSLYAQAVLAICGKRSKIVKDLLLYDGEIEHLIAFDELRSDCADNGSGRTVSEWLKSWTALFSRTNSKTRLRAEHSEV
jgi:hypothetical protein